MTTPIPEAELMLGLPIEDWKWLLDTGTWSAEPDDTIRAEKMYGHLQAQLDRQMAALKAVKKPEESRLRTANSG